MIFLTMGTGFGAGVIADGRLLSGASGQAGEIGHVRLSPSGPVGYNKAGSVEGWVSGGGMAQVAQQEVESAISGGEATAVAREIDCKWSADGEGCFRCRAARGRTGQTDYSRHRLPIWARR